MSQQIWQLTTTSPHETERLGQCLGQNLKGGLPTETSNGSLAGVVIELRSDLGGGKTTFTRGIAAGLKSAEKVSSPTFTLQQIYEAGDLQIHHYDFYRLSEPGVLAAQLAESLDNPKAITIVEWAKTVEHVLPAERLVIELEPTLASADERTIIVKYPTKLEAVIEKVQTIWQRSEP